MSERVLVLGATSGIARALCRVLAARGCTLVLAGRDTEELSRISRDLDVRYGATAEIARFDALEFDTHRKLTDKLAPTLDGVVLAYGYMTEQAETQQSFDEARRTIDVNFTSAVSVLEPIAAAFETRGSGWIAVISSVAGDRGRQSNYTYGASKAGLTAYVAGLRNRLCKAGVHVLTVKPGFVDTSMTQGKVDPNSPLMASPERVATEIDAAIRARTDVLYTPWFWRGVMGAIKSIPEALFKRLKL